MMNSDSPTDVVPSVRGEEVRELGAPMGFHELPDGRREGHDAGGEDHRNHARHVHPQGQIGLAALGHPPPDHALGVLHGNAALAFLHEHDPRDNGEHEEGHHHLEDLVLGRPPAWIPEGSRETIEAKISSEMPLPMPRWVISSPIHISMMQPVVRQTTMRKMCGASKWLTTVRPLWPERVEEEDVANRLRKGQADGQIARVLGDARLTDLAFLGELLQGGDGHLQQLQDDRGGDVGHDPQREDRDPPRPPPEKRFSRPRMFEPPNSF